VHGVDDLGVVNPLQVNRGDPEMGVPELALDDHQRDALMGHLDRVRMPQLVGREATPDPRHRGSSSQLAARGRRLPVASGGQAVDHAQQWADGEPDAELLPGFELLLIPTSE
jgi:hypothetical protein